MDGTTAATVKQRATRPSPAHSSGREVLGAKSQNRTVRKIT